jgi:hypothetical protein
VPLQSIRHVVAFRADAGRIGPHGQHEMLECVDRVDRNMRRQIGDTPAAVSHLQFLEGRLQRDGLPGGVEGNEDHGGLGHEGTSR